MPHHEHRGTSYGNVLDRLHRFLKPKTYFEIGTQTGESLALARCASLAVDPQFLVGRNVMEGKPRCTLYQDTSDAFFRDSTPEAFLGGPVDLAFLDGMHWYEYLLRDFYHTEAFCRPNSVVVMHDCIPPDLHVGRRLDSDRRLAAGSRFPDWWAGDVWKAAVILRKARPDLRILALDAPPTGLIIITNLDPERGGDWRRDYHAQIDAVRDLDLADYSIDRLRDELAIKSTALLDSDEAMSTMFWL